MKTETMKELYVTRAELAYALDLSETRVAQLVQSGALPASQGRGRYNLPASMRAYLKTVRNKQTRLTEERARLTKVRADREEFLLKVKTKEYLAREPLSKWLFEVVRTCRDTMLSIPDRLAGILAAEGDQFKVHAALSQEIHRALTDFANGTQKYPDDDD